METPTKPINGRRRKRMLEGFSVETQYAQTYDAELKTSTAYPIQVDRDLTLRFDLPSSPHLHIDFNKWI